MLSTLYAMLLLCALASLVENKLSIWNQLGTHEKFWIIFAAAYAVILTASGFLSAVIKWRTAGFIHAVLMLGIAGLVLFGIANDWVTVLVQTMLLPASLLLRISSSSPVEC